MTQLKLYKMLNSDRDLLNRVVEIEKLRNKRLFITGATGFFGLNLLEALSHLNQTFNLNLELTALVRDQKKAESTFLKFGIPTSFISFIESDLSGFSKVRIDHPAYDCIFHFAANTDLARLLEHPERERKVIIDGTHQVLEFSNRVGCKRIIYLSSGAVYGKQIANPAKIKESMSGDHHPLESDVYGSAKVIAEQACINLSEKYGISTTILRGFAFAGPHLRLDAHYAIGNLISSAMQDDSITVREGATVRSYLNAMDAVVWMLKAAFSNQAGKIYNLGSDHPVTMEELAQKILKLTGKKNLQVLNRSVTPDVYVPDVDLVKKELGVEVYTSLDQSIGNMIEWNYGKIS